MITHGFPPVRHSGVFRAASFAKYLPEHGIEVVTLTASEPLQSVLAYPGEQARWVGQEPSVVRVSFADDVSRSRKSAETLGLRIPGIAGAIKNSRLLRTAKAIWKRASAFSNFDDVDAVLATSPPPEAAVLGWTVSRKLNVPFLCDLRDPWTYYMGAVYRSAFDLRVEAGLEARVLDDAARIIVTTDTARADLGSDLGIDTNKIAVIGNGFERERCDLAGQRATKSASTRTFDIVYAGLGNYHPPRPTVFRDLLKNCLGLDVRPVEVDYNTRSPLYLLEAMKLAAARSPAFRRFACLRWLGPVDTVTHDLFERFAGCFHLDVTGAVSEQASIDAVFRAQLLVLLQVEMRRDGRDHCSAIPAKTFTCLASEKPILAALQPGELREMLRNYSGVMLVGPRDVEAIASAFLSEFEAWCARGGVEVKHARHGLASHERGALARKLSEILKEVTTQCQLRGNVHVAASSRPTRAY